MSKTLLLTGSNGLLGKAILRNLPSHIKPITFNSCDIDLTNRFEAEGLFNLATPIDLCIHAAAKVGGVGAHIGKHSKFFYDNSLMNLHIIDLCKQYNVKSLLAISSVAAFPHNCSYLTEDLICDGKVHESERGYALSKRIIDDQIQLYRQEYGVNFCNIIPTNLYGPEDNFNILTGHVIASLIAKIYLAKQNNTDLEVWSDGLSLRQFLYVDDFARILIQLLDFDHLPDRLLVSQPKTYNIRDVADILRLLIGFSNNIIYNYNDLSGIRAREVNISRLASLMDLKFTPLEEGLRTTLHWYINNYELART